MIDEIQQSLTTAIQLLGERGDLPKSLAIEPKIERTRDASHGDYASNIAMALARPAKMPPRALAEMLLEVLVAPDFVERCDIAGPGFINFHIRSNRWSEVIRRILTEADQYGHNSAAQPLRIHIEFVSANPTGPLHVGHGRGAAYGASLANVLAAVGHTVHREYYVNDMGRQMDILAMSVWLRALQESGVNLDFPEKAYQGDYLLEIARSLLKTEPGAGTAPSEFLLPKDQGDAEAHLDALIEYAQFCLGKPLFGRAQQLALQSILDDIRADLAEFNVHYDSWFSERSLGESGRIDQEMDKLESAGLTYVKEGAIWFRATRFDDEKDRVLRRENGLTTYFASDVAYHLDKYQRGYDRMINIWGADHHGYVPRVRAALTALELDEKLLQIQLVQFASLFRNGEKLAMSTRSGSFVTLRELRNEVGGDAARFYYVMRKSDQHMDFDLSLAVSQSKDNPVYYVQYAHARVCRMLDKLQEQGLSWDQHDALQHLERLQEAEEQDLLSRLEAWPDTLARAAEQAAPHGIASYLRELAGKFHQYYNTHRVLVDEQELRDARIALSVAVRQVIHNGLSLLGVSAPERM